MMPLLKLLDDAYLFLHKMDHGSESNNGELGRHTNIHTSRTQRYRNFCNTNRMGDEVYVLLKFPNNGIAHLRKIFA